MSSESDKQIQLIHRRPFRKPEDQTNKKIDTLEENSYP